MVHVRNVESASVSLVERVTRAVSLVRPIDLAIATVLMLAISSSVYVVMQLCALTARRNRVKIS